MPSLLFSRTLTRSTSHRIVLHLICLLYTSESNLNFLFFADKRRFVPVEHHNCKPMYVTLVFAFILLQFAKRGHLHLVHLIGLLANPLFLLILYYRSEGC